MLTLVLEASTSQASVALLTDDAVVADVTVTSHDPVTGTRVEGLMPAVAAALRQVQREPKDLSSVICSAGPGSFTSLRSAAAIAKGLCSVLGIPLYGVSSLELLIATGRLQPGKYLAALDAGRGEYYARLLEVAENGVTPLGLVTLLARAALEATAHEQHASVIGPQLAIDVSPRAAAAFALMANIIDAGPVVLDGWEPWYGRLAEAQVKWEAAHGRPLAL